MAYLSCSSGCMHFAWTNNYSPHFPNFCHGFGITGFSLTMHHIFYSNYLASDTLSYAESKFSEQEIFLNIFYIWILVFEGHVFSYALSDLRSSEILLYKYCMDRLSIHLNGDFCGFLDFSPNKMFLHIGHIGISFFFPCVFPCVQLR